MLVSIVTPCFNSAEYLEQCILSIKGQKRDNYEHIIVDGGSTDGTLDIIRKYDGTYPMRWISEKDGGMYEAIAKGFRMAKGDIFAWLNSDDMYMPWTTYTMERVCSSGKIDWCIGLQGDYSKAGMYYMAGRPAPWTYQFSQALMKLGWYDGRRHMYVQQESSFWTRSLYEKVGGVSEHYKYAGDFDLWHRMAAHAKLRTINVVLGGFRHHEGQKSADIDKYNAELPSLSWFFPIAKKCKLYALAHCILCLNNPLVQIQNLPEI